MAPPPLNTLKGLLDNALAEVPPGRTIWVALSGGLDSCLLLALAAALAEPAGRSLRAIHVNHGLQAAAESFEAHSRVLCERLNVPLTVTKVAVETSGKGIEGAARDARYKAFFETIPAGDALWLAQHQTDQAETFLLAALRGSGVRGLAGMPYRRQSQGVTLMRPWLFIARAELETAARVLDLSWCEDPTNSDIALDRNRLRHQVLATLRERWPAADAALASSAAHAGEADTLLTEYAEAELLTLLGENHTLDATALSERSRPRQRLLIRTFCHQHGLPTPPQKRLESLLEQLTAKPDAEVCIEWPGAQARLWRQRLYLLKPYEPLPEWAVDWNGQTALKTPLGPLGWQVAASQQSVSARSQPLRVTWRQGGEVIHLPGRGRRDVKRLLQEADVPPWERERLVVIMQADSCIGVISPPATLLWQAAGVVFTRLTSSA